MVRFTNVYELMIELNHANQLFSSVLIFFLLFCSFLFHVENISALNNVEK